MPRDVTRQDQECDQELLERERNPHLVRGEAGPAAGWLATICSTAPGVSARAAPRPPAGTMIDGRSQLG